VTWAALQRDGQAAQGLRPSEGAALLALDCEPSGALARLAHVEFHSAQAWQHSAALLSQRLQHLQLAAPDLVVIAPWGDAVRARLTEAVGRPCLDLSTTLGETLAAAPALAWVAALGQLQPGQRALVLSAGMDGGLGLVALDRVPEALR
jgi:hypothetical protein